MSTGVTLLEARQEEKIPWGASTPQCHKALTADTSLLTVPALFSPQVLTADSYLQTTLKRGRARGDTNLRATTGEKSEKSWQ